MYGLVRNSQCVERWFGDFVGVLELWEGNIICVRYYMCAHSAICLTAEDGIFYVLVSFDFEWSNFPWVISTYSSHWCRIAQVIQ